MLTETYQLTESSIDYFQENGHVYLPQLISKDQLSFYRSEIMAWAADFQKKQQAIEDRDTYGKAFLQMMNLWEENETIRQFTMAKRFASVAARLLGVEAVRLYHDQALFKEPGGGKTPWHQDQYYWPFDTKQTVTMWMPLVDIEEGMGMLTFASKTQDVTLPLMEISDQSEQLIANFVEEKGFQIVAQKTMQAGDATFHQGWTLHAAPGNTTNKMREVMTVIYVADGARVAEVQNKHQEADRLRWLAGKAPGELVDSYLNPLL